MFLRGDREHAAGRDLHRLADAFHDHGDRVGQGDGTGDGRGDEFTRAVPQHGGGAHSPADHHAAERVVDGEQQRLGPAHVVDGDEGPAVGEPVGADPRALGAHVGQGRVEGGGEHRLPSVQAGRHGVVLGALAREEQGDGPGPLRGDRLRLVHRGGGQRGDGDGGAAHRSGLGAARHHGGQCGERLVVQTREQGQQFAAHPLLVLLVPARPQQQPVPARVGGAVSVDQGRQLGRGVGVRGGEAEDAEDGVAVGHRLRRAFDRVDRDGPGLGLVETGDEREVGGSVVEFLVGQAQGAAGRRGGAHREALVLGGEGGVRRVGTDVDDGPYGQIAGGAAESTQHRGDRGRRRRHGRPVLSGGTRTDHQPPDHRAVSRQRHGYLLVGRGPPRPVGQGSTGNQGWGEESGRGERPGSGGSRVRGQGSRGCGSGEECGPPLAAGDPESGRPAPSGSGLAALAGVDELKQSTGGLGVDDRVVRDADAVGALDLAYDLQQGERVVAEFQERGVEDVAVQVDALLLARALAQHPGQVGQGDGGARGGGHGGSSVG